MSIESAIREYLINHGIKQSFIAEKCGLTRQKMNAIIMGKRKITAKEYQAVCDVVGVSYDYFYNVAKQDSD